VRNLIATIMLLLAPTCVAEQAKVLVTREQAISAAVKADRAETNIGSYEAEAKLVAGSDPSWSLGWRDVDRDALEKWLTSIKSKQIWRVSVCPTIIGPSGHSERRGCIESFVDAASGEIIKLP